MIRIALSLLILGLLLWTANIYPARAAPSPCSQDEQSKADAASDTAHDWDALYRAYQRFRNCDDGGTAERFSDTVVNLLAHNWQTTPRLFSLISRDAKFGDFILEHIDATADQDDLIRFQETARFFCPKRETQLCSHMISQANEALAEMKAAGLTDSGPPDIPGPENEVANPTSARVFVNYLDVGNLKITFETTKLSDLVRHFPQEHIHAHRDAGGAESWVCFSVLTTSGKLRLWPSSGEIEGGDLIDGIAVEPTIGGSDRDCPQIFAGNVRVVLDGVISPGISKSTAMKRLGNPSTVFGQVLSYDFEVPLPDNKKGCSIGGGIDMEFKGDHVFRLWANKLRSC